MMKSWSFVLAVLSVSLVLTNGDLQIQQVIAELRNKSSETFHENDEEVGKILKDVEAVMNPTVDPCDNFYRFVCGRFSDKSRSPSDHAIEEIKSRITSKYEQEEPLESEDKSSLIKHSRNLYKFCRNSKTVESLDEFILRDIEEIGGWPVLKGDSWNKSAFDWKRTISNAGNQTTWIHYLFPASLYRSIDGIFFKFDPISYNNKNALKLAARLSGNNSIAVEELENVNEFSKNLSDVFFSFTEQRWVSVQITLQSLIDEYPYYPWLEHFRYLLPDIQLNDTLFMNHDKIIYQMHFLLNNTDQRMLANLVAWKRVSDIDKNLAVYEKLQKNPDSKNCFELVSRVFPLAPTVLYLHEFSYDKKMNETKELAQEISDKIRQQFIEMLDKANWINDRTYLLEKIQRISHRFGYILNDFEDKLLNEYYSKLELNQTSFYDAILSYTEVARVVQLNKKLEPHNRKLNKNFAELIDTGFAYYNKLFNSIMMEWPLLDRHFIDANQPLWMNFASFGGIIAREFGQSLDPNLIQLDANGMINHWYIDSTRYIGYHNKIRCLNDLYRDIANVDRDFLKKYKYELDTTNNDVADNLGTQAAYLAYKNSSVKGNSRILYGKVFTPDQLFWIYSTNRLCTVEQPLTEVFKQTVMLRQISQNSNELRVLASLSNIKGFSRDFNCPPNSQMNRQPKCDIL